MQKEPIERIEELWLKVQSSFMLKKHTEIRRTISRHAIEEKKCLYIRTLAF